MKRVFDNSNSRKLFCTYKILTDKIKAIKKSNAENIFERSQNDMFCEKCGAKIPDGVKFCTECGAQLEAEESTFSQYDAQMNAQGQQAPKSMTEQFIANNNQAQYGNPQGQPNFGPKGQPNYGPQQGYNQTNYGPRPGYNNPPTPPYGPNGMNQGNYGYNGMPPQKKSSALPLILILVAAGVAVALIIFFVMRNKNGGEPDPNGGNSGSSITSEITSRNSGTSNSSQNTANSKVTIPAGGKVLKDAALEDDLEGEYKGTFNFTVYEADPAMFDITDPDEIEEFNKAIKELKEATHDAELEIYYDGDWELSIKGYANIWADDFEGDESEGAVQKGNHLIEEFKNGNYSVAVDLSQKVEDDPDYGTGTMKSHMEHTGTLYELDGKKMIAGYYTQTLDTPKGKATIAGTFTVEKEEDTSTSTKPISPNSSSSRTSSTPASSAKPEETDFSSLSTTETPQFSDFLWFTDDVYFNGSPAAKKVQKDYSALMGSWKALAFIDPDNKMDSQSYDYSTYTFGGTADFATLKTKRYSLYLFNGGMTVDVSGEGPLSWNGAFKNGTISFEGAGAITIDEVYTYNGREYALGHYYYPSGENGPLALVRP